jgi:phenylalanyl-tRNA synthetase beta chain
MLVTGQPLHAFDWDKLGDKTITIRQAQPGEKMRSINGEQVILNSNDLVSSCQQEVIELVGIMGSAESSVTATTNNLLVASVKVAAASIKGSVKHTGINSRASQYFSHQRNLEDSNLALAYFNSLLVTEQSTAKVSLKLDKSSVIKPLELTITKEFVVRKLGQPLTIKQINQLLNRLNFVYQENNGNYQVTIPSYRPDVTTREDLLEELLRLIDYNSIEGKLPLINAVTLPTQVH